MDKSGEFVIEPIFDDIRY
ncbi:hypothetical protein [Campylobacter coli]|nr:hypothetical protein [Campylobacter coli]